jgi:hypothetical protein
MTQIHTLVRRFGTTSMSAITPTFCSGSARSSHRCRTLRDERLRPRSSDPPPPAADDEFLLYDRPFINDGLLFSQRHANLIVADVSRPGLAVDWATFNHDLLTLEVYGNLLVLGFYVLTDDDLTGLNRTLADAKFLFCAGQPLVIPSS